MNSINGQLKDEFQSEIESQSSSRLTEVDWEKVWSVVRKGLRVTLIDDFAVFIQTQIIWQSQ
jgi:hypothetical protein